MLGEGQAKDQRQMRGRDRIEEQINDGNVIIDDDDRERKKERGRGAQTTNKFALCKVHEPLSQGLLVYIV